MKKKYQTPLSVLDGPILDSAHFAIDISNNDYPFFLPLIKNLQTIPFPTNVTFFVGENGTGKSTILEALAYKAGFGFIGGSKNIHAQVLSETSYKSIASLTECLTLSWRIKPEDGYFFRAESFFNIADYLEALAREGGEGPEKTFAPYGGKSLHEQSHGESFLAFFSNRLGDNGFFIFDEPEAALSPQRQLSLLAIIHQLSTTAHAQFIIATHSPLLLAYPHATIYSCDEGKLKTVSYTETNHYRITKNFLNSPESYLQHLLHHDD